MFRAWSLRARRASAHCFPGRHPAGFHPHRPAARPRSTVYERKPEQLLPMLAFVPARWRLPCSKKLVESTVKEKTIFQHLKAEARDTGHSFHAVLEARLRDYLILLWDMPLFDLGLPFIRTQTTFSYLLTWSLLSGRNANNFCLIERL